MQYVDARPFVTAPCEDTPAPPVHRPRRAAVPLRVLVGVAVKAAVLFLVSQMWIVQGYRVQGKCMEPSFFTGERILGSKIALLGGVQRGDVVVFQPPHKPHTSFIKRVVGLPGELIEIRNNQVFVNGRRLIEPYLRRVWHDDRRAERVPPNMVFVMGDNRDNSNDSRMWGDLPISSIHAKAWVRYWPPERAGVVH